MITSSSKCSIAGNPCVYRFITQIAMGKPVTCAQACRNPLYTAWLLEDPTVRERLANKRYAGVKVDRAPLTEADKLYQIRLSIRPFKIE